MITQILTTYRELERQNSCHDNISSAFAENHLNEYRRITEEQEEKSAKRAKLEYQQDSLAKYSDMGDVAFSTACVIGGITCITTGAAPGSGASLVATGSVSIGNIVMKYTGGWLGLTRKCTSNEESAKYWADTGYNIVKYGTTLVSVGIAGIKYLTDPPILSKLSWPEIGAHVAAGAQSAFRGLTEYTFAAFKYRTENIIAEEDCFNELRSKELFLASDYRQHILNQYENEKQFSENTSKVIQGQQEALKTTL